MSLPLQLDRRTRRFGAAIIGYIGAVAYGWAMARHLNVERVHPDDRAYVLVLAVTGALAGWLVIDRLGRPGRMGLLRDIGVALAALILAFFAAMLVLFAPLALFSPLMVLGGLFDPVIGPVTIVGGVILLAYSRMTATAPPPRRPTTPPA